MRVACRSAAPASRTLRTACRLRLPRIGARAAASMSQQQQQATHDAADAELQHRFRQFLATKPHIILGSQSASRRLIMDELASEYGFDYTTEVAGIDEQAIRHDEAQQLVRDLAAAKADAIIAKLRAQGAALGPGSFLVTCDQVVTYRGQIREKPEDAAQAREFIDSYGSAPACTVGSVMVTDLASGESCMDTDTAQVHFSPIPGHVADALIEDGEVMWCAGGLMVEHPAVAPYLTKMVGTQDSVMGLPKALVMRLLAQAGGC